MRPRLEATSRRRSASAGRRRGPVDRAASMPQIHSTSRSRHRIGRALEPLGMIALHADLLGERAPNVAGVSRAFDNCGEVPLRPPPEVLARQRVVVDAVDAWKK